jgi:hypothetical protein
MGGTPVPLGREHQGASFTCLAHVSSPGAPLRLFAATDAGLLFDIDVGGRVVTGVFRLHGGGINDVAVVPQTPCVLLHFFSSFFFQSFLKKSSRIVVWILAD